jgi:hypothetical protein
LCIIDFFLKKIKNTHSYPDKISGYPRRFIQENIQIFDIRRISDILYSNSISEQNICIRIRYPKKVRISENSIRTSVHHLRIWIRTDIFRTILHPYRGRAMVGLHRGGRASGGSATLGPSDGDAPETGKQTVVAAVDP